MPPSKYPKKVFLESSVLWQLGPTLENVEFAHLLEIKKSIRFETFVSEVSWLEYLRERKREIRKHLESSVGVRKALEQQGKSVPEFAEAFQKTTAYLDNIDAHYRVRAAERGIQIIPLAKIDLSRLLRMSIDCTAPFEGLESKTKEKGFRDSLIMFSILEVLRGRPEENALVITNDGLLADGLLLHAEEYKTRVRIAKTFGEAATILTETITEAERSRLRLEVSEAIKMLMRYREEISAKVNETRELTDRDLGQYYLFGLFGSSKTDYVDITSVESVSFDQITSAVWRDKNKDTSRILFDCRCNADVVARAPHLRAFSDESRRHRVGQASPPSGVFVTNFSFDSGPTEKKKLHFQMYGEANLLRKEGDWQLQNLRLDKSPPSPEELDALMEARDLAFGLGQAS